jgi:hypothetical protein
MFLTHSNSVYTEDIVLLNNIKYPQYVHRVASGGVPVAKGIKIMPTELVQYVLKGEYGASEGTSTAIQEAISRADNKIGLIFASGGNIWTGFYPAIYTSPDYPRYKVPLFGMTQIYAGNIANQLGEFEYISTDSTSCISGHSAWYSAQNLIKLGILNSVVVITTDNGISEDYLHIFGDHGLSKLKEEEEDPNIVKFRLGQGCNISIFESEDTVVNHGLSPLAEINEVRVAAEAYSNPLGISCTGAGYRKVLSGLESYSPDFIKTHSTFSADNRVEDKVIQNIFGGIRTINYKLRIGHTMGAATAVETHIAIEEEYGVFISIGAGMGNVFSSAVVTILEQS